jgi:Tfp pilus assembly protein PilF
MGKYDLAVNDYDIAIQLAPNDGGLFIDRGKVLRTQSKFDQAISVSISAEI